MARTSQERKRRRSARRGGQEAADRGRDAAPDDDFEDEPDGNSDGDASSLTDSDGVFSTLKNTAADAALVVLKPVAKRAATRAAEFAVEQGPRLLEDTVLPKLAEAGGPKALVQDLVSGNGAAGNLLSRVTGGGNGDGGGDAGDGTGKGRRMPVQQSVDVAAPIDVVYDQFTQFEDWPKFMHRAERVEQRDETHVVFHEKVWGINREWEAEIVEQRPDERIVWKSVNGLAHTGVVTFHELAERLTRVEVNVDVDPHGPIEKIGRGARFIKRAVRADLKRFKAYIEMHEEETGAWRGEIEDAEVVGYDDEDYEDEYSDDEEYDEYEDEPEAEYEDEEYEEEDDDEEGDEEGDEPQRRQTPKRGKARTRSASKSQSSKSSSSSRGGSSSRSRGSSSKSKGSSSSGRSRGSSKSKSGSSSAKGSSRSSSSRSSSGRSSSSRSRGGKSSGGSKSSSSKSGSSRSKASSSRRKS